MKQKKRSPLGRHSEKEIEVDKTVKTDLVNLETEGTEVRAVANCTFKEYSPVEEQDEDAIPKH